MSEYGIIKLVHLGAFLFWLGPPLGAWLVWRSVEGGYSWLDCGKSKQSFFLTLILEHVAFIALLVSGFFMAVKYDLLGAVWLAQKLHIVILLVVPLEVVDIFLGNWVASRASTKLYSGKVLKSWERRGLEIYHGVFTKTALVVIPIAVLLIMYLATGKVGFGTVY